MRRWRRRPGDLDEGGPSALARHLVAVTDECLASRARSQEVIDGPRFEPVARAHQLSTSGVASMNAMLCCPGPEGTLIARAALGERLTIFLRYIRRKSEKREYAIPSHDRVTPRCRQPHHRGLRAETSGLQSGRRRGLRRRGDWLGLRRQLGRCGCTSDDRYAGRQRCRFGRRPRLGLGGAADRPRRRLGLCPGEARRPAEVKGR